MAAYKRSRELTLSPTPEVRLNEGVVWPDYFQSNNVVLATPVLLQRLEELGSSASALGDPTLIAMIDKLRRHLTTGNGLDA
jgi:hypothetical protein